MRKLILYLALIPSLGLNLLSGQIVGEYKETPKLLIPRPENKAPSLLAPKKQKQFHSADFFNPKLEFKDPKSDLNNPPVNFGRGEQFLDPGKQYLNRLNRRPEKEKNPNQFKVDQYLGDFRNNGKWLRFTIPAWPTECRLLGL